MQRWRPSRRAMAPWRSFEDMDRWMDEFFRGGVPSMWRGEEGMAWAPRIELFDKGDRLMARVEIPGMKKDDINISVSGDVLTVSGERKAEEEVKEENVYRAEMAYGRFSRSLTLPASVEADKIEATYESGILEISLPKVEAVKPKKIEIKAKK
ncbi:MAG: Hsp20/alpha crystallin family protein [Chloroflexi bacterium]|nr:Hsp20/alpha crystallin family protein [Chloroflexota bacterium]